MRKRRASWCLPGFNVQASILQQTAAWTKLPSEAAVVAREANSNLTFAVDCESQAKGRTGTIALSVYSRHDIPSHRHRCTRLRRVAAVTTGKRSTPPDAEQQNPASRLVDISHLSTYRLNQSRSEERRVGKDGR